MPEKVWTKEEATAEPRTGAVECFWTGSRIGRAKDQVHDHVSSGNQCQERWPRDRDEAVIKTERRTPATPHTTNGERPVALQKPIAVSGRDLTAESKIAVPCPLARFAGHPAIVSFQLQAVYGLAPQT